MTIGENIKRLRERSDMNQSDLARAIGVTRSLISQYESDDVAPRMGNVEKLAAALHCTKSEIVDTIAPDGELAADERELIAMYRKMDKRARHDLMQIAASLSSCNIDASGSQSVA